MIIDCREDPCGECRYCRHHQGPREAELPTVPLDPALDWPTPTLDQAGDDRAAGGGGR